MNLTKCYLAVVTLALFSVNGCSSGGAHRGWVVAEGGGVSARTPWSTELFGWMVQRAREGGVGGPGSSLGAVVIGAIPLTDDAGRLEPDERLGDLIGAGATSAVGLVVDQSNADCEAVYDAICSARVVFIRGGDQTRYVHWWKGTRTEAAIRRVYETGGVVGGTSAGCAILGEWSFDAAMGSLQPVEALSDARHARVSMTHDFLGLVPGVLFDTHFAERGRLPRLAVMLGNVWASEGGGAIVGIGVDPRTAACVGPDGRIEVRGEGGVSVLRRRPATGISIRAGAPPGVTAIGFDQLAAGTVLELDGTILGRPAGVSRVEGGHDVERGAIDIVLDGAGDASGAASWVAAKEEQRGEWPARTGEGRVGAVACADAWGEGASKQHQTLGVLCEVAGNPWRPGYWIPRGAAVRFTSADGAGEVRAGSPGSGGASVVVLDAGGATWAGVLSVQAGRAWNPHAEGMVLHVLPPGASIARESSALVVR